MTREELVTLAGIVGHAVYALDAYHERVVTGESAVRCYPLPIFAHWRRDDLPLLPDEAFGPEGDFVAFVDAFIAGYDYHKEYT